MKADIKKKFKSYLVHIQPLLMQIREIIYNTAEEYDIAPIEETLKWGEPSYLAKGGSTVRFDWKSKSPEKYCVYFNCNTKLVDTFKELYGNLFTYEGNRATAFNVSQKIPLSELKHCISLSLRYHKLKHLPLLGA